MVSPVVSLTLGSTGDGQSYSKQYTARWKQAMPIDRPLPYGVLIGRRLSYSGSGPAANSNANNAASYWAPHTGAAGTDLSNRTYDKFKSKVSESASLGAMLAEYSQSLAMIAKRASQLRDAARALRRLDFGAFGRALGVSIPPNKRKEAKKFADLWLEFSFGWSPLVGDIYSAVEVLQGSTDPKRVRASSSTPWESPKTRTDNPPNWTERSCKGRVHCVMGGYVEVTNPNLALADRLGLVNPATVAWEVIPFSFVVDWFINVEQFLSQGTDFLGLTLTDTYTTRAFKGVATFSSFTTFQGLRRQTYEVGLVSRVLGITGPTLMVRPYRAPSWRRAASAISLLVQKLR